MARIKLTGRRTKMGLRVAKALILGRAKRPSSFNLCIASHLKGKKHPTDSKGHGMRNEKWQEMFVRAAEACGAKITKKKK
jgi:hypothetical protein